MYVSRKHSSYLDTTNYASAEFITAAVHSDLQNLCVQIKIPSTRCNLNIQWVFALVVSITTSCELRKLCIDTLDTNLDAFLKWFDPTDSKILDGLLVASSLTSFVFTSSNSLTAHNKTLATMFPRAYAEGIIAKI